MTQVRRRVFILSQLTHSLSQLREYFLMRVNLAVGREREQQLRKLVLTVALHLVLR